ncbi:hypothetical protein [Roseimarinus sediminis]|uniref:hypothetical protein n=1 Tax=Roseimarinus sediminis TaxID=1610899 RepID=UPI003D234870
MNILFRVDAGNKIGLGHFYRSMNLATQLGKRGHNIFFSYINSDFWQNEIQNDFPFLSVSLESEKAEEQTLQYVTKQKIQIYYVDGIIEFSEEFISKLKNSVKIIFYQNLSKSKKNADIFILPSIHQNDAFFDDFNERTQIYIGLKYFTFNSVITKIEQKQNISNKLSSIAIAAGGSDPQNTLLTLYNYFAKFNKGITYNFFYGLDFMHAESIPKELPNHIQFKHFNHREILTNDILITSFGVSTYEFLYLGIPLISYGHQKSNAEASDVLAQKTNAFLSLGEISNLNNQKIEYSLEMIQQYEIREALSQRGKKLLDLKGTNRIIKIIENIN